jgi:hypothetical protein
MTQQPVNPTFDWRGTVRNRSVSATLDIPGVAHAVAAPSNLSATALQTATISLGSVAQTGLPAKPLDWRGTVRNRSVSATLDTPGVAHASAGLFKQSGGSPM